MAVWTVTNGIKKKAEEHALWQKDDWVIRHITYWGFSSFQVTTEDDNYPQFRFHEGPSGDGVNMYNLDYETELISSLDCWMEEFIWPDDMPDEEREKLQDLWDEDSYSGFEGDGWINYETEFLLYGSLSIVRSE